MTKKKENFETAIKRELTFVYPWPFVTSKIKTINIKYK